MLLPRIYYLHNSHLIKYILNLGGIGLIITCLFCGYEALKDPYSWSLGQNLVYYAFIRICYALGALMLIMSIFLGHFNVALRSLQNNYFRAFGKLSFSAALISPLVITLMYQGQTYAMYLTIMGGVVFGMGNIVSILLVSLVLYLTVEYPLKQLVLTLKEAITAGSQKNLIE